MPEVNNDNIDPRYTKDGFFTKKDDILGIESDLPTSDYQSRELLEQYNSQLDKLLRPDAEDGVLAIQIKGSHIDDVVNELVINQGVKSKTNKKVKELVNQWGSFVPDIIKNYVASYYDLDNKKALYNTPYILDIKYRVPEYSLDKLTTLINQSPVLAQCIEAMVANVVGNGLTIGYKDNIINKREAETDPNVVSEKAYLKDLVDNINPEQSLYDLLQAVARDYYSYGHFYVACRRNPKNKREIVELIHIPAPYVRVMKEEDEQLDSGTLKRGDRTVTTVTRKCYKRYVAITPRYNKQGELWKELEFFKEFGSKAQLDGRTGILLPDVLDGSHVAALELYHGRAYDATSSYGKPVWLNQLSAIVGQIEADSINLTNFTQNMIPQLLFLVSNMAMARNDLTNLESTLNSSRSSTSNRRRKVAVLRGVTSNPRVVDPEHANVRDAGMSVIKLNDAENKELLFGGYDKQCSDRIRSSFRLPPIIVGLTDDYNKATSTTSLKVAEQQVFALQRKFFEDIFNNKLLRGRDGTTFKHVKISLNLSSIEDKEDESIFLEAMSKVGALTPNMALTEYNKFTGHDYELFPEDWANRPIALSQLMLQQAFAAAGRGVEYDPMSGIVTPSESSIEKSGSSNEKGRPNKKVDDTPIIRGPYNKDGIPNE